MKKGKKIDDKKKATDNGQYPKAVVGALIYKDDGEILLTKSSKWGDLWQIPGGKIELGETSEQALKREIKEETGLEIDNLEFNDFQDCVFPELFEKKVHFIFIDYRAKPVSGKIKEKNREMTGYVWIKPEEALKKLKLNPYTKVAIGKFIEKMGDDYEGMYKRALADYQNLLKQSVQERQEFAKYANEGLILEIIPVYDNLKMSLAHVNKEAEKNGWLEGINHIIRQFRNILESMGVEEIKTIGRKFGPETMEAVDGKGEKVVKEIKPGYKLNGKVIVPAKVVVG